MKSFEGKVLFLDRSDINTDEIIPARYLTEMTKEALRPYALEGLKFDGFDPGKDLAGKSVIVTRSNFGCGSSREHAPWALEANGFQLVIAESFARIFRQNMYNCGMMAVELPPGVIDLLFRLGKGRDVSIIADLKASRFVVKANGEEERIDFSISDFDRRLVLAGGWLNYADTRY
ncbi:MAG: 3-isopropylmalate dehydratase small subunit [Chrysiogenales bacterium]|nr:MAG: 3-isopropylmalate dehydratase small subunit [Chrysiogenales bacterium]